MRINGIDYDRREVELANQGIPPDGDDDTAFGVAQVYCNQHMRAHGTGWCTVSNIEKFPLPADVSTAEAEVKRLQAALAH
jgi:hypothetical protein